MSRKPQFGRIFKRKKKNSDGSVIELGPWWIEFYRNGVQERESSKSERYVDAQALLKLRHAEIVNGTFGGLAAERVTVARLLDDLKLDFEVNGKSVEWLAFVDKHLRPFFGSMKASHIGTEAIQRYITFRRGAGIANGTINRELGRLRRAFNLGRQATPPKVNHVPRIPTLEENNVRKGFFEYEQFSVLRSELPEQLKPVITFGYYTGCRKGEVLYLRWSQIDLSHRMIRLESGETKNGEARIVPLMGELFEMLIMQKQLRDQFWPDCEWVFFRHGKRIKDFRGAWEQASKRAGLVDERGNPERLFHDLRRTAVRNMIRAGVSERVAMAISGHKTRSVFDRYDIVSERDIREAGWKLERYVGDFQNPPSKDTSRTPEPSMGTANHDHTRNLLN
ncbi:MAG: tyrosine-type recombinase/integrase [Bryobacteraceae bacterium]